ncbi:DUF805 domain-containing protein [Pseudaestuariivita rosea]|uniref:DUF805 domain-containing protein n=1 Tax=Pseudaestuariivita rosea TaxID=2763263 RepID=UPI001ABA6830|nr:DUF805 domain-containing protein [Pseudaestuariivita rosea]
MGFMEAVKTCLNKYVTFSGRARRSEYWWFYLFAFLVTLVATIIDGVLGIMILYPITALGLLLPSIAAGVRRLHDTDRSGWWYLIVLVPIVGPIVLLVFWVMDGTKGDNRFGPDPKGDTADVDAFT